MLTTARPAAVCSGYIFNSSEATKSNHTPTAHLNLVIFFSKTSTESPQNKLQTQSEDMEELDMTDMAQIADLFAPKMSFRGVELRAMVTAAMERPVRSVSSSLEDLSQEEGANKELDSSLSALDSAEGSAKVVSTDGDGEEKEKTRRGDGDVKSALRSRKKRKGKGKGTRFGSL